jgi:hypothetical protein
MPDSNKAWGRRLIICCDGTWQTSVSDKENIPSNVTKLVRLVKNFGTDKEDSNKKWHQIVYYDSGIGTGNLSGVESARQGGTGAGLMENVIEAYNFIVSNYEPGDEIFCFGFSRGAFTARAVSGLITSKISRTPKKRSLSLTTISSTTRTMGSGSRNTGRRFSKRKSPLSFRVHPQTTRVRSRLLAFGILLGAWVSLTWQVRTWEVCEKSLAFITRNCLDVSLCINQSGTSADGNNQVWSMHTMPLLWMNGDQLSDLRCGTSIQRRTRSLS